MSKPFKVGCVRPEPEMETSISANDESTKNKHLSVKGVENMIKVGKAAPNFELSGYHKGEFKQFQLSEFKDKWVLLCFYPGDYTFV